MRLVRRGELVVAAVLLVLGSVDLGPWLGLTNIVLLMALVGWPATAGLLLRNAGLVASRPATRAYWLFAPALVIGSIALAVSYNLLDEGWDVAVLLMVGIASPLVVLLVILARRRPRIALAGALRAAALFGAVGVVLGLAGVHLAVVLGATYGLVCHAELVTLTVAYPPDPENRAVAADG